MEVPSLLAVDSVLPENRNYKIIEEIIKNYIFVKKAQIFN